VVPEAEFEQTEAGLVPASAGWFVMNARDARWFHRPGRDSLPLTGDDELEAETYFPMLGMSIQVLAPGEPNSMYHWETEQEDFLVLSGGAADRRGTRAAAQAVGLRALPARDAARVRGCGRRRLRDPRGLVATVPGERPLGLLHGRPARRHNACADDETQDGDVAYARVPPSHPVRYRDGLLPDL
jgi:hypothetical protein